MSVEEQRTKLILKQAKTNESSNISEGIESCVAGSGQSGCVESSLARLVEQWSVLISSLLLQVHLLLG